MTKYERLSKQLSYFRCAQRQHMEDLLQILEQERVPAPELTLAVDDGLLFRWPQLRLFCWPTVHMIEGPGYEWIGEEVSSADLARQVQHARRALASK